MLVNINGVQVETESHGGLVYMHNLSGEDRFVVLGGRPLRMPHDHYWHAPVNPQTGYRILTPAQIEENKPWYSLKNFLRKFYP